MRRLAIVLAGLMLAAQAPLPPDPPASIEARSAPTPPEKPVEAEEQAGAVPAPPPPPVAPEEDAPAAPERATSPDGAPADTAPAEDGDGAEVPVPPEVPPELEEAREEEEAGIDEEDDAEAGEDEEPARPLVVDTTDPADEAACRARLTELDAEWEEQETLKEGRCGLTHGLRLTQAAGLELVPAATLNCRTAEALTLWLRDDVIPTAEEELDMKPTGVMIGGSYVCRNRNGRSGARLSEHAFGNAVDVAALVFDEEAVSVKPRAGGESAERAAFQKEIRTDACERFTTVLGPGTDTAHRNHFHFDLRQRSRGYRLCQ